MEYFGFTETDKFRLRAAKLIGEDEIAYLQFVLCEHPLDGKVIQASGGIRKLRWSLSGRGKRGGARVIYYFALSDERIILLDIYSKNQKADLTRNEIRELRVTVDEWLEQIRIPKKK
ncbi:MAG: type II toxin-antitoxin system RelE/ParE family toxin [Pyrinomonadaceae bacterium]